MSFLRYSKSKYRNIPVFEEPARWRPRRITVIVALLVFGTSVAAIAAYATSSSVDLASAEHADKPLSDDLDTVDLIDEADKLHREAQAFEEGDQTDKAAVEPIKKTGSVTSVRGDVALALLQDSEKNKSAAVASASRAAQKAAVAKSPKLPPRKEIKTASITAGPQILRHIIKAGDSITKTVQDLGISSKDAKKVLQALRKSVNLERVRPGDAFTVEHSNTKKPFVVDKFVFAPKTHGHPVRYVATRTKKGFEVKKKKADITKKVVSVSGAIDSSLYNALRADGEGSALVSQFADIFAWNVDFYRQTRKGDTYKVIAEKLYADGKFYRYGKVLAAEYKNGRTTYRGYNFKSENGKVQGVFDDSGDSLERSFIKSPLEVVRITSSFGQRFHPVLKRWRKHDGVDYGASSGTPFWTVADGTVVEKRFSKTAGNMIVVRHALGYTTQYFHASKFAKGLRVGQKVKQREVIGYVGTTGRSTGPHLHFGMKRHGRYVSPAKQEFPAAHPVPKKYRSEFLREIAPLKSELERLPIS